MNNIQQYREWYVSRYIDQTKYNTFRRLRGDIMVHIPALDTISDSDIHEAYMSVTQETRVNGELQPQAKHLDPRQDMNWGNSDWDDVLLPQWHRYTVCEFLQEQRDRAFHRFCEVAK